MIKLNHFQRFALDRALRQVGTNARDIVSSMNAHGYVPTLSVHKGYDDNEARQEAAAILVNAGGRVFMNGNILEGAKACG